MGHSGLAVSTVIKGCMFSRKQSGHFCYQLPVKHFTFKVARWRFSESIALTFEHKLRRHLQWLGKITNTAVLNKDENLLWSRLQRLRSCYSNEMMPLSILLAAVFLGTGNCSFKIVQRRFSSNSHLDVRNLSERYQDIVGWSFHEYK